MKGHKWLLLIGDCFFKYILLFPLQNATAKSIESILEDKVFGLWLSGNSDL